MDKIYFDHSATSFPKAPGVATAMFNFMNSGCVNLNRSTSNDSYNLAYQVIDVRERLANMFNFKYPNHVVFTSGITMSLNMILKGLLQPGDHVIISSIEHNAVVRPLTQLKDKGVSFSIAKCDSYGQTVIENFYDVMACNTKVVVVSHASNVCGTIANLDKIGAFCKQHELILIVDAAQTAGILEIDMEANHIDVLTFTGHKSLLGPQGIGGFLIMPEITKLIEPLIAGGTGSFSDSDMMPCVMPDRYEAGTQNIAGIIGLGAALEFIEQQKICNLFEHEKNLALYFLSKIQTIPNVKHIGMPRLQGSCPIVALDFVGFDNAMISYRLENDYHITTRCGLHCSYLAHQTLCTYPQGVVRFSFGYSNTIEQVDVCIDAIKKIIQED